MRCRRANADAETRCIINELVHGIHVFGEGSEVKCVRPPPCHAGRPDEANEEGQESFACTVTNRPRIMAKRSVSRRWAPAMSA